MDKDTFFVGERDGKPIQLQLAQTAQQGGDTKVAIAAYERFLKLAPDDPSAPIVAQQLKQLKAPPAASPTG